MIQMFSMPFLTSMLSDQSMASLVLIGLAAFGGGVLLMLRHKKEIDIVFAECKDIRIRLFERRKFLRRSLASTLIAAMGIMMLSLYWAHEPNVFIALIFVILILLTAVLFLACLDLMSVSIHTATQDDSSARRKMVEEYVRQRQRLLDRVKQSDDSE